MLFMFYVLNVFVFFFSIGNWFCAKEVSRFLHILIRVVETHMEAY